MKQPICTCVELEDICPLCKAAPELYEQLSELLTLLCNMRDLYPSADVEKAVAYASRTRTWNKANTALASARGEVQP